MSPTELLSEGQLGRVRWAIWFLVVVIGAAIGFLVWIAVTLDFGFSFR